MNASVRHDQIAEQSAFRAAKVQVLGLAPLKTRLAERWTRLSSLVHKLFEGAIAAAQGPADHFYPLDELAYVVTFKDLSEAEAQVACVSIAKEVCKQLYGDQIDEISVRMLVGEITAPEQVDSDKVKNLLNSILEASGTETVVTKSIHSGASEPVIAVSGVRQTPPVAEMEEIRAAHTLFQSRFGLRIGFFPVWELRKGTSSSLFLTPFLGTATEVAMSGRRCLDGLDEEAIADAEISLLNAAAAYARRINDAGKVCAVGVGVSYGTLTIFRLRIRYITALQKLRVPASSPLLLKLEQIPIGTPVNRIGELVAMLKLTNVRMMVEFQSLAQIPDMDVRIGAIGFGGALPANTDYDQAKRIAEKLVLKASLQKAFTFMDRLDNGSLVSAMYNCNVRFGTGTALGVRNFAGLEAVPDFPVTLAQG